MSLNPYLYNRRTVRLKHFDYSNNGAYFITICVKNMKCVFGDVIDGKIVEHKGSIYPLQGTSFATPRHIAELLNQSMKYSTF